MYAMQYQLTLPADYDMAIIRDRVAERAANTDYFAGLGLKAYLIQERKSGGIVNQYAPFYLWARISGMGRFLWEGGGFDGVVQSFGRPVVYHWTGVGFARAASEVVRPRVAILRTRQIAMTENLMKVAASSRAEVAEKSTHAGVFASAAAIDPTTWTLLHFTLCETASVEEPGQRYEVLHLSRPGLDALATD